MNSKKSAGVLQMKVKRFVYCKEKSLLIACNVMDAKSNG